MWSCACDGHNAGAKGRRTPSGQAGNADVEQRQFLLRGDGTGSRQRCSQGCPGTLGEGLKGKGLGLLALNGQHEADIVLIRLNSIEAESGWPGSSSFSGRNRLRGSIQVFFPSPPTRELEYPVSRNCRYDF